MRYLPDRALPDTAYLPGRGPRPEPPAPVDAYRWGVDLFNHGFPWEAHEAWELVWNASPPDSVERARLAGLIQLAAAVVQQRLGRDRGVATLAHRAAGNLVAAGADALAAAVIAWAERGEPLPPLTP